MKVAIQHLALGINAQRGVIFYRHRGRPLLCYDVYLVSLQRLPEVVLAKAEISSRMLVSLRIPIGIVCVGGRFSTVELLRHLFQILDLIFSESSLGRFRRQLILILSLFFVFDFKLMLVDTWLLRDRLGQAFQKGLLDWLVCLLLDSGVETGESLVEHIVHVLVGAGGGVALHDVLLPSLRASLSLGDAEREHAHLLY